MDTALLEQEYGVSILSVKEVQGGWSARAFLLETDAGRRFLKLYDRHRPTAASWIARIDNYAPAMAALWENPHLRGRMPELLPTKAGNCKVQDADFVYLLFDYIDGPTLRDEPLDAAQTERLGEIVGALHSLVPPCPFPTGGMAEDISLPFGQKLLDALGRFDSMPATLQLLLCRYREQLEWSVRELLRLLADVRVPCERLGLCHTDIHGGNIMLDGDGNLVLLDWEGLCIAPAEADFFDLSAEPLFGAFLKGYSRFVPGYAPDPDLIRFYRLRRRLEDIWEFVAQLLYDNPDGETEWDALYYMERDLRWLEEQMEKGDALLYTIK